MSKQIHDPKLCESCGRYFEFRKKWEKDWPQIKYCSDKCKKNKNKFDYKDSILKLLKLRGPGKTICPSEILTDGLKQNKLMMEHVRRSARLLAAENLIEITQGGKVVNPHEFKGPIRLRIK